MSGPCDRSAGSALNANAEPSGAYAAFVSMTWRPWAISTVCAAARLGVGAGLSVGTGEAVVSGVGVASAEVDGVSVGAAGDGSPLLAAVAVSVGVSVGGGGLVVGLAGGRWLEPASGACVG